ncbi:guanyl nucleotide binding protein [Rhodotorula toruloides]|uniref:Guanyl nucleotide binding protein n=1 Tax=Rhodotorula toruloides TaxID=5286 RepID=A0A511K8X5_RHOTO|nr:guanyl nucleotide binding protein [Rhodotorula toruloides]
MAFSPNGSRLCCGFENAIEIFDVSQPGAEGYRLHTTPTRSSRQGQKGIISSLAFSFVDSYSDSILAAGSFSGSIGLYDISGPVPLTTLLQPSQTGGITKLLFHPLSPHLLFAASRKSTHLDVWDLRNTSRTSSSGKLSRQGRTNQRLGFDIDPSGTWLAAGDQDGNLSIFSAQPLPDQLEPVTTFSLSSEPISTTLFHPFAPLLVTTSGARKFGGAPRTQRDSVDSIGCDSSEDDDGTDADVQEGGLDVEERNSLELWRLS